MSGCAWHDKALALDSQDALAGFRDRFRRVSGMIYLDGNSLGLLCKDAEQTVLRALDEWRKLAIDGWLDAEPAWFEYGERLGEMMAPLVGAEPDEVVVTGSTTVNLHALVLSFLSQMPVDKRTVLADNQNFPSDLYALDADARLLGGQLKMVESEDGRFITEQAVIRAMTPDIGVAVMPSVLYRSGQLLDMQLLAREASTRGIVLGFDCSHSAGVVPHHFGHWDVDFAFWCTYKYMNGGPGSTAALYLNKKHRDTTPSLAGWWGHRKSTQFEMNTWFEKASGAGAFQIGTPSILGSAALFGVLDVMLEAGIERIREKSVRATAFLIDMVDDVLSELGFGCGTPRESGARGGHVALCHESAWQICEAMKRRRIVPDFRPPDIIRLAPSPLYTSFEEVYQAVCGIRDIVVSGEHEKLNSRRRLVT